MRKLARIDDAATSLSIENTRSAIHMVFASGKRDGFVQEGSFKTRILSKHGLFFNNYN